MNTPEFILWALPFVVPICIWVAWSDLKFMKIPNYAVIALILVFIVVGAWKLPLDTFAWRWSHFAVVLLVGFLLNTIQGIGAGDAKFAAAMAPFFALGDVVMGLGLFALCLLGTFFMHRLVRMIPAVRKFLPNWVSLTHKQFPMGIALISTLLIYLSDAAALHA